MTSSPFSKEGAALSQWGTLIDFLAVDRNVLEGFSCGNEELDRWFLAQASKDCCCGLCSCRVCNLYDRSVGGFFALSPSLISPKSVAGSLRGGINRQPIPAYLIGRVGVRTDLQGKGLGTALIHEALGIIMRVARETGGRLVLIDAKSEELASWYEHLGFRRLTDSPLRLVMKIHSIGRVLANV